MNECALGYELGAVKRMRVSRALFHSSPSRRRVRVPINHVISLDFSFVRACTPFLSSARLWLWLDSPLALLVFTQHSAWLSRQTQSASS